MAFPYPFRRTSQDRSCSKNLFSLGPAGTVLSFASMKNWLRAAIISVPMMAISSADCTFLNKPEEFLRKPDQRWQEISGWTSKVSPPIAAADTNPIPRKNFIDDYIFGRMERDGIRPAPISDNQEFLRRVYLD